MDGRLLALVTATSRWVRSRDGVETPGVTTHTDTHARTPGGWLCILAQLTPIAPENCPRDDTIIVKHLRGGKQ